MANNAAADTLFQHLDINGDGQIDRSEIRERLGGTTGLRTVVHESTTGRFNAGDNNAGRCDQVTSYDVVIGANYYGNERVINTSSAEETSRHLASLGNDVYRDPNPRIIHRNDTGSPMSHEQRITVKYLRPPTPPPPEPIIIREVRPSQPPVPPPVIIKEHLPGLPTPPPLILRERPPSPPPRLPAETRTRVLPPVPVPPRSVVIERFPAAPAKPRDIIIERWLPYGPRPERRTIVEPAPPAMKYPEPTHTVILHGSGTARVVRKFENLGVVRADPSSYRAMHGSSLLDSATLVHEAHSAGVIEDISTPGGTFTQPGYTGRYTDTCDYVETAPRRTYTTEECCVGETTYDQQYGGCENFGGDRSYQVTYRSPNN